MCAQRVTKRDSIIEAASQLIRAKGVRATSISGIIAASGASTGTIYHHFAGKNEIVLAVAHRIIAEPLQEALAARAGEGLAPSDLFRSVVDMVIRGEIQSTLILQLWAGSSQEPQLRVLVQDLMADGRAKVVAELERWLQKRQIADANSRAETLAMLIVGQAMGLLAQRTIVSDLDDDLYVSHACRMLDMFALQGEFDVNSSCV